MPAGDVYTGELHFELQNNFNIYSFFYEVTNESNETTVARDIAVHIKEDVWPLIKPDVRINFLAHCAIAREVCPATSLNSVIRIDEPGEEDAINVETLPGQCSLLAQLFGDTENPNRHNRGRDFWTGFSDSAQVNGFWQAAKIADVQAFYEALPKSFTSENANTLRWGVFSPTRCKQNKAEPPPEPLHQVFWPVQLVRLVFAVRTQRRREHFDPCFTTAPFDPNI